VVVHESCGALWTRLADRERIVNSSPGACEGFDDHVESENYEFSQVTAHVDFDRRIFSFARADKKWSKGTVLTVDQLTA
jgi:hypothetical protein